MSRIRTTFVLLLAVGLVGCYSKTQIQSQPSGAKVVLDGKKYLGESPIELEEMVWLWTDHQLTFTKPGYEPFVLPIDSEGLEFAYLAACVCTGGLLLPLMFASKYKRQYVVTLYPEQPEQGEPVREQASISFDGKH